MSEYFSQPAAKSLYNSYYNAHGVTDKTAYRDGLNLTMTKPPDYNPPEP